MPIGSNHYPPQEAAALRLRPASRPVPRPGRGSFGRKTGLCLEARGAEKEGRKMGEVGGVLALVAARLGAPLRAGGIERRDRGLIRCRLTRRGRLTRRWR